MHLISANNLAKRERMIKSGDGSVDGKSLTNHMRLHFAASTSKNCCLACGFFKPSSIFNSASPPWTPPRSRAYAPAKKKTPPPIANAQLGLLASSWPLVSS